MFPKYFETAYIKVILRCHHPITDTQGKWQLDNSSPSIYYGGSWEKNFDDGIGLSNKLGTISGDLLCKIKSYKRCSIEYNYRHTSSSLRQTRKHIHERNSVRVWNLKGRFDQWYMPKLSLLDYKFGTSKIVIFVFHYSKSKKLCTKNWSWICVQSNWWKDSNK